MANPHHLDIARAGRGTWNKWRKDYRNEKADFSGVDFTLDENKDISFCGFEFGDHARFDDTKFGAEAQFDSASFGIDARFGCAKFGFGVSFRGATFGDQARFDGATFGDDARFYDAMFGDNVRFDNAKFGDDSWFGAKGDIGFGAEFGYGASFKGATFGNDAWFNDTTFENDARFDDAKFGDCAHVGCSTFGRGASFRGATFGNAASFERTLFGDDAEFDDAVFGDNACFDDAIFGNNARFNNATFEGNARFGTKFGDDDRFGAKFGGKASFNDAKFNNVATFESASFEGDARFTGAAFGAGARFNEATFGSDAQFGRTIFGDGARFDKAAFGADARFDRATFKGTAIFDAARRERELVEFSKSPHFSSRFEAYEAPNSSENLNLGSSFRSVCFSHARFLGVASFVDRDFKGEADFTNAIFDVPPDFRSAKARENMDWTRVQFKFGWYPTVGHIRIPVRGWTTHTDTVARLRRLRGIANEIRAVDAERDLFVLERLAERGIFWRDWWRGGLLTRLNGWFRPLTATILMFLYRYSSNFGRSALLPVIWLGIFSWGFYRLYLILYLSLIERPLFVPVRRALFDLTFVSAVPFGSTARPAFQSVIQKLFQSESGLLVIPWQFHAASAAQGIINVMLVFLLGLALRNYYKFRL